VHSADMQIHIDSKGKVALDDITLWANPCTNYVSEGEFFIGNYVLRHPTTTMVR